MSQSNDFTQDIKFRAFICAALNARALDLWLDVIAKTITSLTKWYSEGSFIRSAGWAHVSCYDDRFASSYSYWFFRLSKN